jgi:hypothetical protein
MHDAAAYDLHGVLLGTRFFVQGRALVFNMRFDA